MHAPLFSERGQKAAHRRAEAGAGDIDLHRLALDRGCGLFFHNRVCAHAGLLVDVAGPEYSSPTLAAKTRTRRGWGTKL